MSTHDPKLPVLDYQPPGDPDVPIDMDEQRVAAVLFVLGILMIVVVGMGLLVHFVIRSLL